MGMARAAGRDRDRVDAHACATLEPGPGLRADLLRVADPGDSARPLPRSDPAGLRAGRRVGGGTGGGAGARAALDVARAGRCRLGGPGGGALAVGRRVHPIERLCQRAPRRRWTRASRAWRRA